MDKYRESQAHWGLCADFSDGEFEVRRISYLFVDCRRHIAGLLCDKESGEAELLMNQHFASRIYLKYFSSRNGDEFFIDVYDKYKKEYNLFNLLYIIKIEILQRRICVN
jgi:hypothetical protein